MEPSLAARIAAVLGEPADSVLETSTADDFARWDSQTEVEIALMLEFEYRIELDAKEISQLKSVKSIREVLASHNVRA